QFMESITYRRGLEGELARTMASLSNVTGARVHLAIPEQSVFVRDRRDPSASVFLDVLGGQRVSNELGDRKSHRCDRPTAVPFERSLSLQRTTMRLKRSSEWPRSGTISPGTMATAQTPGASLFPDCHVLRTGASRHCGCSGTRL
ncbi:hypothetical protein CF392_10480, partial [Tamilnaduibacter salinus]